jgi:uncharacterized protein (DUF302 family)/uncharacterized membrane protein YidH (DUF202 family)
MTDQAMSGPTDFLAAERTFLAWIRTALALMGFGFVVARFGLFLEALRLNQPALQLQTYGLSFWFGTVLIAIGVVVNLAAAWRYLHLMQELKSGGSTFNRPSSLAVAVAVILAALGLAMAIYLVSVRQPALAKADNHEAKTMTPTPSKDNGIVTIASQQSVDRTVENVQAILKTKGVKLFALVDHSGEAKAAGLEMRPTKLLIFGSPKRGTPLMIASPSIAIDLPLKVLVWEDAAGKVWISYNAPAYLQARHDLPQALVPVLASVEGLAAKAAE